MERSTHICGSFETFCLDNLELSEREIGLSIPFVQLLGIDLWEGNQIYNLLRERDGYIAIKRSVGS